MDHVIELNLIWKCNTWQSPYKGRAWRKGDAHAREEDQLLTILPVHPYGSSLCLIAWLFFELCVMQVEKRCYEARAQPKMSTLTGLLELIIALKIGLSPCPCSVFEVGLYLSTNWLQREGLLATQQLLAFCSTPFAFPSYSARVWQDLVPSTDSKSCR